MTTARSSLAMLPSHVRSRWVRSTPRLTSDAFLRLTTPTSLSTQHAAQLHTCKMLRASIVHSADAIGWRRVSRKYSYNRACANTDVGSRNLLSSAATALQEHLQRCGCLGRTLIIRRASRLGSKTSRTEPSWLAKTTHKQTCLWVGHVSDKCRGVTSD